MSHKNTVCWTLCAPT